MFGRYITFGHLEILYPDTETKVLNSGFKQEGWDWNRFTGTTTIHMPLDKLRANVLNVDDSSGIEQMLLSDEAFAGGVSDNNGDGIFAMKLHGHDKYDLGSFRANKSVFFFENRIICLGSDIENTIIEYPTETTLFQTHLVKRDVPIYWGNTNEITAFPFQRSSELQQTTWLLDTQGNGYYLPAGQIVNVSRQTQFSRSEKDSEDTQGDFAAAWLDHGKAPGMGGYEYVILVNVKTEDIEKFATEMSSSKTAAYSVLQKNKSAHIVRDNQTGTIGYVLFERYNGMPEGLIRSTDQPCMIMTHQSENELALSISNPDLRLYEGPADEKFDADGRRIERSIYSRDWRENESALSKIQVTVNGLWEEAEPAQQHRIISAQANNTIIEFDCKDGLTVHALVNKVKQ
jgi:chondroitin-sulfate-ABC endolyase/exolyase